MLIKIRHYGHQFQSNSNATLLIHGIHHWYIRLK
jgi:hypothetical protein